MADIKKIEEGMSGQAAAKIIFDNDSTLDQSLGLSIGDYFTIEDYGVRYNDGVLAPNIDYLATPFIPINKNEDIIISGYRSSGNIALLAYFDKNQTFISSVFNDIPIGFNKDLLIKKEGFPPAAEYIRCTGHKDYECRVFNLTLKFVIEKMEGLTFIDMNTLFPGLEFMTKEDARNSVPIPLRRPNMTLKYTIRDNAEIIIESARAVGNWGSEANWTVVQNREIQDLSDLYVIIDLKGNVLFRIDKNGVCHFKGVDQFIYISNEKYLFAIADADDNILFSIDKYGYIDGKFPSSGEASIIKNNLRNQGDLLSGFREVKNYGTQQAEYLLEANFKGRVSVRGGFKNNVNAADRDVPFIEFESGTTIQNSLSVRHRLPQQGYDSYSGIAGKVPFARLTSGFECGGNTLIYDRIQANVPAKQGGRNNLCGDKIMMLWFKGRDVANKMHQITTAENPEEYFLPTERDMNTMPVIINPIGGIATIDLLTPERIYFITNKITQLVINNVRTIASGDDKAWVTSSRAYIVTNWGTSTAISFGSSGITNDATSDVPIANGYSTLQIFNKTCTIKNTTTRAFNNYLPYEDLKARSELFEQYQDLYINISNDTFTIGRDGSGIIFTTPLKVGSSWKTLTAFFNEMVPQTANDNYPNEALPRATISVLNDFYITFMNMSAEKTCESILQSGKIYLIGSYQQALPLNPSGHGNPPFTLAVNNEYDCYPYFVYDKIDTQQHVFDLILTDSQIKVYVNGEKITTIPKSANIRLGSADSDLQLYDLEITKGHLGDAEIQSDDYYLVSSRTPFLLGIIAHDFYDTYQGSLHPLSNAGCSITKIYDIARELIDKGYTTISMQELSDWLSGARTIPTKSAIIICDDWQIFRNWANNFRIRGSYFRKGVKINFAQVGDRLEGLTHNLLTNLRLAGIGIGSHSRWHNEEMWKKPAPTIWIEMEEMRLIMQEYGFDESIFVFNKAGGQFSPQQDILDYFGYTVGVGLSAGSTHIGATDKYTRSITNRFTINRVNITDVNPPLNAL